MPHAPPRPCTVPGCKELVSSGRCERHSKKTREIGDEERKSSWRFYASKAWRRARGAQLNRQPLCAQCEREGRVTVATEVHHVLKRTDYAALSYDLANLESLCKQCHARESIAERGHNRGHKR